MMAVMLLGCEWNTMSIKPMRSTGMTGQSSSRGMCVTPNTYLHSFDNTDQNNSTRSTIATLKETECIHNHLPGDVSKPYANIDSNYTNATRT